MRRVLMIVVLSCIAAPQGYADEPEFNGRPLSGWVAMLKTDLQPRKRRAAVVALGQFTAGSDDARVIVLVALGNALRADADPQVREAAAKILAQQEPETAQPAVASLVACVQQERVPAVRRAACQALARYGRIASPSVGALTEALSDANSTVQTAAAEALARIGPDAAPAAGTLLPLAGSPITTVRRAAIRALGRINPEGKPTVAKTLVVALNADDAPLRRDALDSLVLLGDTSAGTLTALGKLLTSADSAERAAAAELIGGLGNAASLLQDDLVLRIRTDTEATVRIEAVRALRRVGGNVVLVAVQRLPQESAFEVRVALLEELGALGASGKTALPAIRAARGDPAPQVREAATTAIKRIESPAEKK